MRWLDVHQRQIEWAGIVLFVVAFWSTFAASACAIYSAVQP